MLSTSAEKIKAKGKQMSLTPKSSTKLLLLPVIIERDDFSVPWHQFHKSGRPHNSLQQFGALIIVVESAL